MEYRIVNDDKLYHYGIPGMKWGVRKAPERTGNGSRQARRGSLLPRKELRPAAVTKAGFRAISRSLGSKKNTKRIVTEKPKAQTNKNTQPRKSKSAKSTTSYANYGAKATAKVIGGVTAAKLGKAMMKNSHNPVLGPTLTRAVGAGLSAVGTVSAVRGTAELAAVGTAKYVDSKNKKSK